MKIRQGFVSNSSSSSFIVGVGKLKSLDKFHKWGKKNNIKISTSNYDDIFIKTTEDLLKMEDWSIGVDGKHLWVEEPINAGGRALTEFDPAGDDFYCIVCIENNEGDQHFWDGEDLKHDIDADYFDTREQNIMEMLSDKDLFENSNMSFGAGRNG